MADRIAQIDVRLNEIEIEKKAAQNEQLLILLAQERLALTNERIALTLPQVGNYPVPVYFIEQYRIFYISVFYLLLMKFI
jgi:hypothetical protein